MALEWLRLLTEQYSAVFDELAERWAGQPGRQLLGLAEFIAADLADAGYPGCPFTNSLAELPDPQHAARRLIEAHKQGQFQRLARLSAEAGLADPVDAAREFTFLLEGAQVVAQNKGMG